MSEIKNTNSQIKVAVGLSGGVDSSVSALLLKEQGYDVTGVFMQCWDAKADGCRADSDRADAVEVASKLGIRFVTLDFVDAYKKRVISYFYEEYKMGRTPNPDVMCNKEIKFGLFLNWAIDKGFDYIATGHYARVAKDLDSYTLLMGKDQSKDQSYFLYQLTQVQLAKTMFPVGHLNKKGVRELPKLHNLHTFDKKDSVGICFIGEVDIKEFLKKEIAPKPGAVVTSSGELIGTHDGVWYYTIGQRHGFTVTKYMGLPLYVVGKDVSTNTLIVGFVKEALCLGFEVSQMHWLGSVPDLPVTCRVRIRHLGELYMAKLHKLSEDSFKVVLEDKIFGVAPGQSAVFYVDDKVLCGGIIR